MRSGHATGGRSQASSGAGRGQAAGWEVIVPMPSRKDLGTAHVDPRLARVTLAARQPDPAWTQRVALGPEGGRRHLSAVWDLALWARGCRPTCASLSPTPL